MRIFSRLFNKTRLNSDQIAALNALHSKQNIFLTGSAGTGKSYLIQQYLKKKKDPPPILASSGSAALLVGGQTIHSYFGLGILVGGIEATVKSASVSPEVVVRISSVKELIIDEVSMIHHRAFEAADQICRIIKESDKPFGGIRLILSGDFYQLPPVDKFADEPTWLFETLTWESLKLRTIELRKIMRSQDPRFLQILAKVRVGNVDSDVSDFIESRLQKVNESFQGTMLFGKKDDTSRFNNTKLNLIAGPEVEYHAEVFPAQTSAKRKRQLIEDSPISEILRLKIGALVMLRKNDPDGRYANGSLGHLKDFSEYELTIECLNGLLVKVQKESFSILDAQDNIIAKVISFPVVLGWAMTIHKSQGASIDRLMININRLWEHGQAYVALSRAKDPLQLYIEDWSPDSIRCNPKVNQFHQLVSSK